MKKKILITTMSLLMFISSQAQIEKGTNAIGVNLGGAFDVWSTSSRSVYNFRVNVQPVFEHFISRNLSLGIAINGNFWFFNNQIKQDFNSTYDFSSYNQEYQMGIQLKKYWFPINQLGFTLSPLVSINYNETSYKQVNSDIVAGKTLRSSSSWSSNFWSYSGTVNIGAVYFINPSIGIELQTNLTNYSFFSNTIVSSDRTSFTVLDFQNYSTLGIKYIFARRKQ